MENLNDFIGKWEAKRYHCWFSKTANYYWLQHHTNNPIYKLEDGQEVEVSCVTENTGDFDADKKNVDKFLFPDSVYLGLGKAVRSASPIIPIQPLSIDSTKEETMANLKAQTIYLENMQKQVAQSKLEAN